MRSFALKQKSAKTRDVRVGEAGRLYIGLDAVVERLTHSAKGEPRHFIATRTLKKL